MKLKIAVHIFYIIMLSVNIFVANKTAYPQVSLASTVMVAFGYGWTVRMLVGEAKE